MIFSSGAAYCHRHSAYSGTCSRLMRAAATILPSRASTNSSPRRQRRARRFPGGVYAALPSGGPQAGLFAAVDALVNGGNGGKIAFHGFANHGNPSCDAEKLPGLRGRRFAPCGHVDSAPQPCYDGSAPERGRRAFRERASRACRSGASAAIVKGGRLMSSDFGSAPALGGAVHPRRAARRRRRGGRHPRQRLRRRAALCPGGGNGPRLRLRTYRRRPWSARGRGLPTGACLRARGLSAPATSAWRNSCRRA